LFRECGKITGFGPFLSSASGGTTAWGADQKGERERMAALVRQEAGSYPFDRNGQCQDGYRMLEPGVILLAEDDEDDILLFRTACREAGITNPLHVVRDGEEAIAYLKGVGRYSCRVEFPLPSLLLLDLKMPQTNGFEVLQWIRSEPELRALRVVVLTSSDEPRDIEEACHLRANSFLVKPKDFGNFVNLFESLHSYWLRHDQPPEIARPGTK
jgi:CheY-like chemotaxis protein